jgi:ketosteroid isomerase-like protein
VAATKRRRTSAAARRPAANPAREQAALEQISREWAQAASTGDLDRIVSYWAEDAIVLAPDQPAAIGKAAIREFVRATMALPGFSITWAPETAAIAASCDLAYMVERNRVTVTGPDGQPHIAFGKAVTIWRKDAAGSWKCVIDTWNGNPRERVLSEG